MRTGDEIAGLQRTLKAKLANEAIAERRVRVEAGQKEWRMSDEVWVKTFVTKTRAEEVALHAQLAQAKFRKEWDDTLEEAIAILTQSEKTMGYSSWTLAAWREARSEVDKIRWQILEAEAVLRDSAEGQGEEGTD